MNFKKLLQKLIAWLNKLQPKPPVATIPDITVYTGLDEAPGETVTITIPEVPPDITKLPPPPTRPEILSVNMHFQGTIVETEQYGTLPWFGAALAWLNADDRKQVYRETAGDTHCIIHIPFGPPLYNDPNQPYSADRFGPLDWTNGGTAIDSRLTDLIKEVIVNGFHVILFLGGDGPDNHNIAYKHLDLLYNNDEFKRILYAYCVVIPGWDSVFYGWEPTTLITGWAAKFRDYWPHGYCGLEHNIGHIPLGEGPNDYSPTGRMKDFDLLLSEYEQDLHKDTCWQINGRLVRPYNRPDDQPRDDDPSPPYYLQYPSPRGPFFHCAFEFGMYEFVRAGCSRGSVETVNLNRSYLKFMGCMFTG